MVMSRSEKITPLIFPSASASWLPAARIVRPLPSRCRAAILGGSKRLISRNQRLIQRDQIGRVIRHVRDLPPQHFVRPVAEKSLGARAHEGIPLLEIHDQDQIGETLQQAAAELLLLGQLALHVAFFGDVDQRSLVADDISSGIPYGARGIEKNGGLAIFASQLDFACAYAAAVIDRSP